MNLKSTNTTTFARMISSENFIAADPKNLADYTHSFSLTNTAFIGGTVAKKDGDWEPFTVVPNGNLILSPAATVLNYGQSIFEGLKARRGVDEKSKDIFLFRPEDNAKRMQNGARRLLLKEVPTDLFISGIVDTIKANKIYVPEAHAGSLYVRPLLFGCGAGLGVASSHEFMFVVYVSPVGHYFKGLSTIPILVTTDYQRAAERGVGAVKAAGNYAASLYPAKLAKTTPATHESHYSETLYLDNSGTYVEEVGAANLMMVKGNTLIVAESESILPGITRASIAHLAKENLKMEVCFEKLPIDQVLGIGKFEKAGQADEVFCTGTAAVLSPIGILGYNGKQYTINNNTVGPIAEKLYTLLNQIQTNEVEDTYKWLLKI